MSMAHTKPSLISLCMIVRDEGHILARCLEAAAPAVDEIIIVDTGSTDDSIEIAKRFGAKVFSHKWNDDFAEARNAAIPHATGEWILWLDADEILQTGSAALLRNAAKDLTVYAYYLHFSNVLDDGKEDHYLLPRLIRNLPGVKWIYALHEQILGHLQSVAEPMGLRSENCKAEIKHFGYLRNEMSRKQKDKRYELLFEKQLALFPDDPYSWYKYGDWLRKQNLDHGIEALKKSLGLIQAMPKAHRENLLYASEVCALLASELQAAGQSAKATETLDTAEKLELPLSANFYFAKACILRQRSAFAEAIKNYQHCLKFADTVSNIAMQWGITGPVSWYGIAQCWVALNQKEKAESAYQKSLHLSPDYLPATLSYTQLLLSQEKQLDALELLTKYFERNPEPTADWNKFGIPLLKQALNRANTTPSAPPLLSLCMIVRNEEDSLERCLHSVQGIIDELIVVDTGSTDRTVEIAKRYGAKIIEDPWQDDFSRARNRSIETARGEWILFLDADEVLEGEAASWIRNALNNSKAIAYELPLKNIDSQGTVKEELYVVRLFRNHPSIRFKNIVHEQILEPLLALAQERKQEILRAEFGILHFGHQDQIETQKGKRERNRKLTEKQLQQNPNDPYSWYQFANFLRPFSPEESKQAIERAFTLLNALPASEARKQIYAAEVYAFYAFDRMHRGESSEALEMLLQAKQRLVETPNFIFAIACLALHNKNAHLSLQMFDRLLQIQEKVFQVPVQPGILGPIAHFGRGESLKFLQRIEEAQRAYKDALSIWPNYEQAQKALEALEHVGEARA